MTDVFLERAFEPPLTVTAVKALLSDAPACFDRHRVRWLESHLARDGHRMVCHFLAPDTESARIALRQAGADARILWRGAVHDTPALDLPGLTSANVLVERSFTRPVTVEQIQVIEDAAAGCLQSHRLRFVRTYASLDGRRMLCLYQAPDAESVRLAQREAGMPLDRVWSFRYFHHCVTATFS